MDGIIPGSKPPCYVDVLFMAPEPGNRYDLGQNCFDSCLQFAERTLGRPVLMTFSTYIWRDLRLVQPIQTSQTAPWVERRRLICMERNPVWRALFLHKERLPLTCFPSNSDIHISMTYESAVFHIGRGEKLSFEVQNFRDSKTPCYKVVLSWDGRASGARPSCTWFRLFDPLKDILVQSSIDANEKVHENSNHDQNDDSAEV